MVLVDYIGIFFLHVAILLATYCIAENLTSCFGLMTDSAVVDSALVDAALRKFGLIIYLCGLRQIRPYIKWKRIIKK